MTKTFYQLIDHTADLGVVVQGKDEKELFSHAALGLFDLMWDLSLIKKEFKREIVLRRGSQRELLQGFLTEIIYLFEVENEVYSQVDVTTLTGQELQAKVWGEKFTPKHVIKRVVKAVTYHGLKIEKTKKGFSAQVIFDV